MRCFKRAVCREATGFLRRSRTRSLTACGSPMSQLWPREVYERQPRWPVMWDEVDDAARAGCPWRSPHSMVGRQRDRSAPELLPGGSQWDECRSGWGTTRLGRRGKTVGLAAGNRRKWWQNPRSLPCWTRPDERQPRFLPPPTLSDSRPLIRLPLQTLSD